MNNSYIYTLRGSPLNYIYLPHLKYKNRLDQQQKLNAERTNLENQHCNITDSPFQGPMSIDVQFCIDANIKQKHKHYLPSGYTIYNLIRFVEKVSEGVIYTYNANIRMYTSSIRYDLEPKTLITVRLE